MYSHLIVGVTDVSRSVPNTVVFTRAFGAKVQNPAQETSGKSEICVSLSVFSKIDGKYSPWD